jgi:histidinol dehydrogenase
MINVFYQPLQKDWESLLQRPIIDKVDLIPKVSSIIEDVRTNGDISVFKYTAQFDKVVLQNIALQTALKENAGAQLSNALKLAIELAKGNIEKFHQAQLQKMERIETMPGVWCWRKSVGIETVGLYVPGGTAPLFSTVLMLGIPAKLAGCKHIILCTPPYNEMGEIHPAIIYAANLVGVTHIYTVGGVQAIAAMAYGTETIMKVNKIFGPGNQYVTAAKQLVQQDGIAIDMPAGPSEVCIWADEAAVPAFVAADLLSQAEHGVDSQVLLVASNETVVANVQEALATQILTLSRKEIVVKALENSKAIVMSNAMDALELINLYAPEHLILAIENAEIYAEKITNAGSVFIGNYAPESVGDYASGTNHTLPTNGFAKAYSGVSVDSFVKKITFQQLTERGLVNIGKAVMEMAKAEGLDGHENAVVVRINEIESKM